VKKCKYNKQLFYNFINEMKKNFIYMNKLLEKETLELVIKLKEFLLKLEDRLNGLFERLKIR